jgi:hypothetical protein
MTIDPMNSQPGRLYIGKESKAIYFILERTPIGVKVLKAGPKLDTNEIHIWRSMSRTIDDAEPNSKRKLIWLLFSKTTFVMSG